MPQIQVEEQTLDVVYSTRLLVVIFTSDMKWDEHIDSMVAKARKKLWFLRRLKGFGASRNNLVELYKLFIRLTLEFAAPLWSGALTLKNKQKLNRIQSNVTNLIIGPNNFNSEERDSLLRLQDLERRRLCLTEKFCKKMVEDDRFKHLFPRKTYKEPGAVTHL